MLALAERRTSWPDVEVFVCVTLGTLIDAAIAVYDAPIRSVGNAAGSLGHIAIVGSTEPCTCGGVGRLDVSYVSEAIDLVGERHPQPVLAVCEPGKRIDEALSSIVNLLNSPVISRHLGASSRGLSPLCLLGSVRECSKPLYPEPATSCTVRPVLMLHRA